MSPEQKSPEAIREARLSQAKLNLADFLTYSDELPPEMISRDNRQYEKHKFRTNWFQGVISNLGFIAKTLQNEELIRDLNLFNEKFSSRRPDEFVPVKALREEIDEADALIRRALALLN